MRKDIGTYWKLFTITFTLSAFTFGGGYVIISMLKKKMVDNLKWIEEKEMLDLTAIAQASPGAIAVNVSVLVGYRIAGFAGSVISVIGTVLPPLIILTIISFFYLAFRDNPAVNALLKGMQAGVAAVIADVVVNLFNNVAKAGKVLPMLVMGGSFTAAYFFKVNLILIILICCIIGVIPVYCAKAKEKKRGGRQ